MKAPIIDPDCRCCYGRGSVIAADDERPCPGCRLTAMWADRIRAAHEASIEAAYREQYGPDFARLATYQAEGR